MAEIPSKMHGLVVESYAKSEEEEKKPYKFKESLDVPQVEPQQILIKVSEGLALNAARISIQYLDTSD
jgi:hypothetical protein